MKRKNLERNDDNSIKKIKLDIPWVSATETRNYMLKDTLVDWLKLNRDNNEKNNDFTNYILEKGKEFEKNVVDYINNKISVISVSDKITIKTCKKTIDLMKSGVPIIHSAPFKDEKRKTKGIIDFLVRSDKINELVNKNITNYNFSVKAPNLDIEYHYIVIDIKFSTLTLKSNGINLLNTGSYPAYKSQVWIYTQAIGDIQGYTPTIGCILGRRWNFTRKGEKFSGINCLDRLGVIDYEKMDLKYIKETENAISWIRDNRMNGHNWNITPPSRVELYPNMCINSGIWNNEKKIISSLISDITEIWSCGVKQRNIAISKNIFSWRDKRCNSEILELKNHRAYIVDKIIDINREEKEKIFPVKIKSDLFNWRDEVNEMFVDFETFSDIFSVNLPLQEKTGRIFMIGVYYKKNYISFISKDRSKDEEYRIMNEFVKFVKNNDNPKLWYWHAENNIWSNAENNIVDNSIHTNMNIVDYISIYWKLDWFDLCKLFREEPIVIKDCFNFGLKNISYAMKKHDMIQTYINSNCKDGLSASIQAWENIDNIEIINDIEKYNKFDVQVLFEILTYLRKNL